MESEEREPKQLEMQKGNRLFSLTESLIALIAPLVGIQKKVNYPFTAINRTAEIVFPLIQGANLIIALKSISKISKEHQKHRRFRYIFLFIAIFLSTIAFISIRLYVTAFYNPHFSESFPMSSLSKIIIGNGWNILPLSNDDLVPSYGVYTRNQKANANNLGIR